MWLSWIKDIKDRRLNDPKTLISSNCIIYKIYCLWAAEIYFISLMCFVRKCFPQVPFPPQLLPYRFTHMGWGDKRDDLQIFYQKICYLVFLEWKNQLSKINMYKSGIQTHTCGKRWVFYSSIYRGPLCLFNTRHKIYCNVNCNWWLVTNYSVIR